MINNLLVHLFIYEIFLPYAGTYETRNGTKRNQLGRVLVKIYYVSLAVPKFAGLFSVVLLYVVVFLY